MAKGLTYMEFQELGKKNYNKGGDVIVECWDEKDFADYVKEFGPVTKAKALRMIAVYKDRESEWNSY